MPLFSRKPKLKVLFVSSEETPFEKVGGLGEVVFSLPRALKHLGYDVRVMIPRYGTIDVSRRDIKMEYEGLEVPTAPGNEGKRLVCNVRRFDPGSDPHDPVTTYFLENQEYYELRSNVYGYKDDRIRFALLSRGCLEFLNMKSDWLPDVIVSTDWITGFLPNFLATDYRDYKGLQSIATVFSIHNILSQGMTRYHKFIPDMERDDGHGPVPDFFDPRMDDMNFLRRGIMYADAVNTVSKKYAEEITTEEFGEGLDALLRDRRDRLFGILNGIDYETNNPETDPALARRFSMKQVELRDENKLELQRRFGLAVDKQVFLAGVVARLTRQKGFTLFPPVIESFLKTTKSQLIVVGEGENEIMNFFNDLQKKFPAQVRANLEFSDELPHLIFGGADVILVPSAFEPSGLTQMEAMRYGAVPVARKVGGLADTVLDFSPETGEGTGFLFEEFDPTAFLIALIRAFTNWRHRSSWRRLQRKVMGQDFSWKHSAKEYEKLFRFAVQMHRKKASGNGGGNGSKPRSYE